MQFSLSEEEIMIQDIARKIAREKLEPVSVKLDKGEGQAEYRANLKYMAENGLNAINVPSEYGGSEAGKVAYALAIQEIAYACAATAVTMSVTNLAAEVLVATASEAVKQYYIPKIASGEYLSAGFCLTESTAGSDPASMRTKATKKGDDYVLNGEKIYITAASTAGFFIVWAVTDSEAKKGKGITAFVVDADAKGIIIGKPEKKMGQRGSNTCTVTFVDVVVQASKIIGKLNDGFRIAVGELAAGRIGIAALSLGVATSAMDKAKAYVKERKQFGQFLADFQGIQWMLADRETELEASRLLMLHAAYLKDNKLPFAKAASMAKLFASEAAGRATDTAIQLFGGSGYMDDTGVERLARDARVTRIYEGTSEVQRMIIAREILRQ